MDIEHKFNEPVVKERRLLKLFALSRSQLYKMIANWIDQGGDPKDMCKLPRMAKQNLWSPQVFLKWELKYIINQQPGEVNFLSDIKKKNKADRTVAFHFTNTNKEISL